MAKKKASSKKGAEAKPDVVTNEGTAVVVKPAAQVPSTEVVKPRGAAENMDAQDVAIPTIILMQSKSTFVEDDTNKIVVGDMVHSMTEEVVGHKESKPLRFVSCYMFKTRQIFHGEGKDAKYVDTEAWLPSMANDDYQSLVKVDGKDVMETRKLVYNHCGYLPDFVREVAGRSVASPVVIKFKGMSKKHCRKQLNSTITDLADFNEASWEYEFLLTAKAEEHDEYGKIQVWQAKLGDKVCEGLETFGQILYNRFKGLQSSGKLKASDKEENTEGTTNEKETVNISEKDVPAEAGKVTF